MSVKVKKAKKPKPVMPEGFFKFRKVIASLIVFVIVLAFTLVFLNHFGVISTY